MGEGGIGNEGVADRIGKLGGLDLEVEAIGPQGSDRPPVDQEGRETRSECSGERGR